MASEESISVEKNVDMKIFSQPGNPFHTRHPRSTKGHFGSVHRKMHPTKICSGNEVFPRPTGRS